MKSLERQTTALQPPALQSPTSLTRRITHSVRSALKSIGWGGSGFGGSAAFVPPLYHHGGNYAHIPGAEFDYHAVAGDLRENTVVAICNAWYAVNFPTARPQVGTIDPESGEFVPLGSEGDTDEAKRLARKRASQHPAVRLLTTRPNPYFTWRQVWASTIEDYNVDGNAIWLKAGGDPYEIYWLPRNRVNIMPGRDRPVEYYEHHEPSGRVKRYHPDQIIHFRDGIDPFFPHLGISRLRRAIRSIATLNTGETYAAATARNGHSGVLITPKGGDIGTQWGSTPEEAELRSVTDRINQGLTGENSGRAEWSTSPMDVNRIGFGPEQMRVDSILNRPETNVASILGLNTMVLGLPSSAGTRSYANYAEADKQAWRNGVIPRQDIFAEFVTDGLLIPEFDESLVMAWDRSFIDAINEDTDAKVERAIKLRAPDGSGKPLIGYNEARDLVDYPPVEGGDLTGIEEAEAEKEADREAMERAEALAEKEEDGGEGEQGESPFLNDDDESDDAVKSLKNCGTGAGGFKPGNDCASGSGGSTASRGDPRKLPKKIADAAKREADGSATPQDRRLLRDWDNASSLVGDDGAKLSKTDRMNLASEHGKLARTEKRWEKRLQAFDRKAEVERSRALAKIEAGAADAKDPEKFRANAESAMREFEAEVERLRPGPEARVAFLASEASSALTYGVSGAIPDPARRTEFVLGSLPESARTPEFVGAFAPEVARESYFWEGGRFDGDTPRDPAAIDAKLAEARADIDRALADLKKRKGG